MGWSQDSRSRGWSVYLLFAGSQWDSWSCGCWFGSPVFRGRSAGHPEKNGPHWPRRWNHWRRSHEFPGSYYGWFPGKDHIYIIPKLGICMYILLCALLPQVSSPLFQTPFLVGLESKQPISTSGNCRRGATSNLGRHWRPRGCQTWASGVGSGMLICSNMVGHCLSM